MLNMVNGTVLFFIALYLVCFVEVIESCANGFVSHGNSCYLFSHETVTWADAVLTCQMLDSNLVEIEDSFENEYLKNVVKGLNGEGWYTGATDKAVEGEFVWMSSKKSLASHQAFKDWYPGEPNNDGHPNEGCMVLFRRFGYRWADDTCEYRGNYICEAQLSGGQTGAPAVVG